MSDKVESYNILTTDGPQVVTSDAGYVLPHEHITIDLRAWWQGDGDWSDLDQPNQGLIPENFAHHQRRPQGTSRENMILSDWYVMAMELRHAVESGCQLLVNLTTTGLDPNHKFDERASSLASLSMVTSVGRYIAPALSELESQRAPESLAEDWLVQAAGTEERGPAGIIGEIGTSERIHPSEASSLRAAAMVQSETGLAINVHLHPFDPQGHAALDILEGEGANLEKVALSHCDGSIDTEMLKSLARRGAYIEFDLFGTGHTWELLSGRGPASDEERIRSIYDLVDAGFGRNLLLSHDICMKSALTRYGGWGYGHLARRIFPVLEDRLGSETTRMLSTHNPLRMLDTGL